MFVLPRISFLSRTSPCRIAFVLRGGVGDILIGLNFIQNFSEFFSSRSETPFTIDLFVPRKRGLFETTRVLCWNQPFIRRVNPLGNFLSGYDLAVEIIRFPLILYARSKKIRSMIPLLGDWLDTVERFYQKHRTANWHGAPGYFLSVQTAFLYGRTRMTQADIDSMIEVKSLFRPSLTLNREEILSRFHLKGTPFLTIQRGVGAGDRNHSTRLWPKTHYEETIRLLRLKYPSLPLLQLGTALNEPLEGVTHDLRGKTSFEEMMILLNAAKCHLDCEAGLVHLRHFLGSGPSVVLFGPTSLDFFGYPENLNLRSDSCPGGCEWLTRDYVRNCPRGLENPPCMSEISVQEVMSAIERVMNRV